MWSVKTYDAADLRRMCSDGFDAIVEVQGAVGCDKPVISFAAQLPCCWLHVVVRREEEKRSRLDTFDHVDRTVRQDTEWITDMDRCYSTVFKVEDKTGSTLVYPEGADIETTKIFDGVVTRDESWLEKLLSGHAGSYHCDRRGVPPDRLRVCARAGLARWQRKRNDPLPGAGLHRSGQAPLRHKPQDRKRANELPADHRQSVLLVRGCCAARRRGLPAGGPRDHPRPQGIVPQL